MRANALSWSPTMPTSILLASEDHNLYTFDVRALTSPTQIYKGHVAAVMSCDWAPTGTEFVSGGWDRTLRIWKEGEGGRSEAYHAKRMQRVFSTIYTGDARFVLSGSDDGNVRIWKAHAAEKLGIVEGRERASREYRATLREKWKYDPEVAKVERCVTFSPPYLHPPLIMYRSFLLFVSQAKTSTQISVCDGQAQTYNARCAQGQGGAPTHALSCWREQAQGGEEEGCRRGADVAWPWGLMDILGNIFLYIRVWP